MPYRVEGITMFSRAALIVGNLSIAVSDSKIGFLCLLTVVSSVDDENSFTDEVLHKGS